MIVSARQEGAISGSQLLLSLPSPNYGWQAILNLEMSAANLGQVAYALGNGSAFDAAPLIPTGQESFFQQFVQSYPQFTTDPGGIRAAVQAYVTANLTAPSAPGVVLANSFVFPGGATFLFKNPTVATLGDLATNITYKSPTGYAAPKH